MIRASIIGANGYTGYELVRLLSQHPNVEIKVITSRSSKGGKISDIYPSLKGLADYVFEDMDIDEIAEKSDVVFAALPHGASANILPGLADKGVRIIDLSGDFRYNDQKVYQMWYGQIHPCPEMLKEAVYGLCEIHREKIKNAKFIGNPGCYTTCSILALAPLVEKKIIDYKNIIIDAKSGVSGAGRAIKQPYHFCECSETLKAYSIAKHRHTSEIEQELSLLAGQDILISFTPHLIPIKRGILSTCYANLAGKHDEDDLIDLYKKYYKNDYFIRVYENGNLPEIHNVVGSNFVDIGIVVDKRLNRVVVVCCVDNLIKGASGQAIQNMNIMFGLDEKTALMTPGLYI